MPAFGMAPTEISRWLEIVGQCPSILPEGPSGPQVRPDVTITAEVTFAIQIKRTVRVPKYTREGVVKVNETKAVPGTLKRVTIPAGSLIEFLKGEKGREIGFFIRNVLVDTDTRRHQLTVRYAEGVYGLRLTAAALPSRHAEAS